MFNRILKDLYMAKTILRLPAVRQRTGLARATIYSKIALGIFPRQIRLGERCVGWVENEIEAWVDQRINETEARRSEVNHNE